jgi:predicted lipoprotein with Yx(FWY)xxD motif
MVLSIAMSVSVLLISTPSSWSATTVLSTSTTSLGKIVVTGKGMTAYYYDLDKPNSGVSACSAACLANWPAIIAPSSSTLKGSLKELGISGKVTILKKTRQVAINGRPIYTFVGDTAKGDVRGQGLEAIWYVISSTGLELKKTPTPIATKKVSRY